LVLAPKVNIRAGDALLYFSPSRHTAIHMMMSVVARGDACRISLEKHMP
jgi:hypothetical protein